MHSRKAEVSRLLRAVERVNGHLRGSVQRKIRRVRMNQARKPQILHDQRIRARLVQKFCVMERRIQFAVARKDIQRDIGFDIPRAAIGDGIRHLVGRKAMCIAARIERAEAHIYRTRARLHGRAHPLR